MLLSGLLKVLDEHYDDLGHKPGHEHWRLEKMAEARGLSRKRINQKRREFIEDLNSTMNVGNSLRKRHLDYIMQELNSMCSSFRMLFRD